MKLNQENIIKDKLLDYEVPFEEEYWEDFKKKLDNDQKAKPTGFPWFKTGLFAMAAGLALLAFLFFKNGNNSTEIASLENNFSNKEQISGNSSSTNNFEYYTNDTDSKNAISDTVVNENRNEQSNKSKVQSGNVKNSSSNSNNTNSKYSLSNKNDATSKGKISQKSNKFSDDFLRERKNQKALKTELNSSTLNFNTTVISNYKTNNAINNTSKTGPTGIIVSTPEYIEGNEQYSNIDGVSGNVAFISNDDKSFTSNSSFSNNSLDKLEKDIKESVKYVNELVALTSMDYPSVMPPKNSNFEPYKSSQEIEFDLPRPKKWEIGFYGGIGLNIPTKYGSLAQEFNIKGGPNVAAGFYFNYALNRRLSVETAFQYKRIVDMFAARYNYEDGINLVQLEETTIVSRLNSFEIPMGINYRLNDWLYFSTGLAIAYVRPSKTFTDYKSENFGSANIEDFYYLTEQENFGLRKVDIRAYAGLTFNVSPFVGFRFLINQGLIDRTKNDYYNTNHYNLHTDYTFSTVIRLNSKVIK